MVPREVYPRTVEQALGIRVRAERVRLLYDVTPLGLGAALLAVALAGAFLLNAVDQTALGLWGLYMLVAFAMGYGLYRRYRREQPLPLEAPRWEHWFAVAAGASSLGWGVLPWIAQGLDSSVHQMLVVAVVCAIAVGALGALQASRPAFLAFATPSLVLLGLSLLAHGDRLNAVAAALIAILYLLVVAVFMRLHRALIGALHSRFYSESLLDEIATAEANLKGALEEQQLLFETAPVGIAVVRDRKIVRCNRRLEEMFGYRRGGLAGALTRVFYANEAAYRETESRIEESLLATSYHDEERELARREGVPIWCRCRGHAIDRRDLAQGVIWVFEDVTEKRLAAQRLAEARDAANAANARLRDAIESIPDAFALFDAEDRLVLANRVYVRTFTEFSDAAEIAGMTFESLVRASIAKGEVIPPEYAGDAQAYIAERVRRHRNPEPGGFVLRASDGRWLQAKERRTADGWIVGVRTDITALKENEARIQHLANHDPLTGLPNRRLLDDRLSQALGLARRSGAQVAAMLIDLDDFKRINDEHGHKIGDRVLQVVSGRLRTAVRQADTVARQGGDEFVVVLPELRQASDAARVGEKVLATISRPIEIDAMRFEVRASVGVAMFPADGEDAEALLKLADVAMYRAKQAGRNNLRFYSPPAGVS